MNLLTEKDETLILAAQEAIRVNYDAVRCNHTVGAAVRCKSGKVYVGVNVYSLHGACAEVILSAEGKRMKVRAKELLPFAYHVEE
ncbi:hypothetical protein AALA13_12120 [Lachnospiraceae bacterium 50-23]|jgi:cytidine deaminase|nr:hypothetical protein [Dorea sp.]GFI36231.1 hypothetical protein IMSAGC015_00390 [Lachnospiraceae bacterium]